MDAHETREAAARNEQPRLVHTFKKMAEHLRDGMVKLFNMAYYGIKRGCPFTDYPEFVDLHKKNGVDLPSCYHSNKACARFLVNINAEIHEDILRDMREARNLSVLIVLYSRWKVCVCDLLLLMVHHAMPFSALGK